MLAYIVGPRNTKGSSIQSKALSKEIVNSVMSTSLSEIIELVESSEHSQEYKDLVIKYATDLIANDLPVIYDLFHMARLIGMRPSRLINMVKDRDHLYNTYKVRKKSGGHRWIMSPIEELRVVQYWILNQVLNKISVHDAAHGFVKEKSIVSNAEQHTGKEVVLNIDLYRFFDTITEKRVYGLIRGLGYTDKLSLDLARLLCVKPDVDYWDTIKKEKVFDEVYITGYEAILPQGAPTSPIISNLIAKNLDLSIATYCTKSNLSFTRYADDITISGNRSNLPTFKIIEKIISDNGFIINRDKVKYIGNHRKQTVTGITVNTGVFVNKKIIKEVSKELYFCNKYGYKDHLKYKFKNSKEKANYKDWLYGKICFIYSVEKEKAKELFKQFHLIDWSI